MASDSRKGRATSRTYTPRLGQLDGRATIAHLFDSSSEWSRAEDTSTSARSLHKRSLSFDPDEATLHSPRHEPAGGTPGLQITSRSTAASTGVQGPRSHTAVPVPAPFFTVDRPKGPRDPAGAADGARAPSTASSASEAPEPRRRRPRHSHDRVRPRRDRRSPPRPRRAPRDPHRGRIHPKSPQKSKRNHPPP